MTVLPVIARELRASSRQPFTYYLRLLGVAALLVASVLFGMKFGFAPTFGRLLFSALHCTLLGAIWVLVPMLAADCISLERREGTLGLLFLTPLKGTDIVVAKGLAHGLRAVTLGLAVLPVLTIPFLLGGVSWSEAVVSVVLNANAMCWALAAGLLASAWSKAWLRALLLAAILTVAFFFAFAAGTGWILWLTLGTGRLPWFQSDGDYHAVPAGLMYIANSRELWSSYIGSLSVSQTFWILGQVTVCSLLVLVAAVLAAGARIRRSWQEEPPSQRRLWWRRKFCTPVLWLVFLRRWMRRKLERNPIGWLEQRTWSGRLVTWGWLAVLISIYSSVLTDPSFLTGSSGVHETMAWLLAGSMAMSAAGSFRRERESGVLELLLVSPLGENQIIAGRLGGLWTQFVPTAGLLLGIWAYCSTFLREGSATGLVLYYLVIFLTVPVFGLYFSLRCRNFLTAFVTTIVVGLVLPLVLSDLLRALWWVGHVDPSAVFEWQMRPSAPGAICQGMLALFCWERLLLRLKKRTFPLERTRTF
jgi:ABC-type transport system involved in multi-copper enzyme maturation permease subunit